MTDTQPSFDFTRWLATQRELVLLLAHDLRNPLAAVLANLNYLELGCGDRDPDTLEAIGDIKLSSETLLRIVENMVTISRLEASLAGAVAPVALHRLDAAPVVRAAFERALPLARAAGVDVSLEVRDEHALLVGDRALLDQVVENLVGNAAQHVRRGQRARLVLDADRAHVTLALDDEGAAFSSAAEDFSREGQVELKKRTDARYSRGLALYLVGLAAKAMGATLEVRGGAGEGGHVALAFRRADV